MRRETIIHDQQLLHELASADNPSLPLKISGGDAGRIAAELRDAWSSVAFSDAGEDVLKRYFSYQVKTIVSLMEKAADIRQLCLLLDDLYHYFGKYPDPEIELPAAYRLHFTAALEPQYQVLHAIARRPDLDEQLKDCLISYIDQLTGDRDSPVKISGLLYFQKLVRGMACPAADLYRQLLDLDFNHLYIFAYHQKAICSRFRGGSRGQKTRFIREQLSLFAQRLNAEEVRYDHRWPSLFTMLAVWLREELAALEPVRLSHAPAVGLRLQLQLSVSHLACLIRLLAKQNLFGSIPLTGVFDFFSLHFSTKRQEQLSAGGISKEYYEKNIVTAAEIKALLLKMIAQINLDHFPVVVAATLVIFYR